MDGVHCMRMFAKRGVFALLAGVFFLVAGAGAHAQEDRFANVEIVPTQVSGSVYMLTGAGGNVGVSVGDDGLLIVDDQFAPLAERIAEALAALSEQAVLGDQLRYVVNSHFHGDHTGGNAFFGEQGATIVAHDRVRVRLLGEQGAAALPVITYDHGANIYVNGDKLVLTALSGHTDGDSAVFFTGDNVLHTGDLLFNQRFPYIDLDSGGGVQAYLDSQAAMLSWIDDDTRIIPGHGPLASKADLQAMHDMIAASYSGVVSAVEAGKSLDDIIEAGVAEEYRHFAWAFIDEERWLTILHRDATTHRSDG